MATLQNRPEMAELKKLGKKIFGYKHCCYYCSTEDLADMVRMLGPHGASALPLLLKCLDLGYDSPVIAACEILGRLGSSARSALPKLERTLTYKNTFLPFTQAHVVAASNHAIRCIIQDNPLAP